MTAEKRKRVLIAFDFDHTIIDDNSDTYIQRLAPNGGKIPEEIAKLYSSRGWTKFMSEVFKYLRSNGTSQTQLLDCVAEIPLVNGMLELLTYLTQTEKEDAAAVQTVPEQMAVYDAIIISDSNSVFIDHILQKVGIRHSFQAVYTNPALFDEDGCLTLKPYHEQDWCKLSSINMCKGHILDTHRSLLLNSHTSGYDLVAYVGDGTNDLCPSLRLKASDIVFPRQGYSLAKKLVSPDCDKPSASVVFWESGVDILNALKTAVSRL